ncbi:MAG: YCF48-related protein, partial [Candidatus Sulfomarinibacteraceae bacterium]
MAHILYSTDFRDPDDHTMYSGRRIDISPSRLAASRAGSRDFESVRRNKGRITMNDIRQQNSAPRKPHALLRTLSIAIFLAASPVAAQWDTQSPLPTHLDVRGVGAPTSQRVFIATDDNSFDNGGALFESADGGATWVQRDVPFSLGSPLNGIFFLDGQNGWTWGNANYRTTDGGTTWAELPLLGSTYFMEFYSTSFGLATGNFGRSVSHDGGLTWEPSPFDIFAFDFAGTQTGLGVAATGLYRTSDGGATFTLVHAGDAEAVVFLSAAVAVGIVDGAFVRSTDGGATWVVGAPVDGRSRLVAVSADVVLAWGRAGAFPDYDDRIFRSSDAGQTWVDLGEVIDPGAFAAPFAFAVPDPQTVVVSDGAGGMHHSSDGGQTWASSFTSPGFQPGFLGSAVPAFADPLTGYFGFGPGFVIKTIDGGATWTQVSSGSGESLTDIDRLADGTLIAVGENGTVLTSAGATPWTLGESVTAAHLRAVQVIGPQDVVAVDETARVFTSADGGATWTAAAATPPGLEAEDLFFTTPLDGWVTGFGFSGAAVYHTTDGGATWTGVPGFSGAYKAIDFVGTSGWAANVGGRFYRTADGGATWIQGDLPGSPLQIQDMDFFDADIGYAVGWWGTAFRSDDGGATWQALPTPNGSDQLTDIFLVGPDELWVSTNDGVAYYSATGGQNWAVLDVGSAGFGNFAAIAASPAGDAWVVGFQGVIERFTGPPPPPVNQPPVASYTYQTTGLSVAFFDTSADPDGTIVSRLWDFGDGSTSTEQDPTHVFPGADTYHVSLVVTDDDGDTDGA